MYSQRTKHDHDHIHPTKYGSTADNGPGNKDMSRLDAYEKYRKSEFTGLKLLQRISERFLNLAKRF